MYGHRSFIIPFKSNVRQLYLIPLENYPILTSPIILDDLIYFEQLPLHFQTLALEALIHIVSQNF